jgi:hypothetical protein
METSARRLGWASCTKGFAALGREVGLAPDKRSTPKCEICPVAGHCAYLRARAVD